jgi:hypothetical protein
VTVAQTNARAVAVVAVLPGKAVVAAGGAATVWLLRLQGQASLGLAVAAAAGYMLLALVAPVAAERALIAEQVGTVAQTWAVAVVAQGRAQLGATAALALLFCKYLLRPL